MAFTKVTKTPSYYSRFQVKLRRRREGRTDYQARRNLIRQDACKYNSPKYRFVTRFTNKRIICQITYATLTGDHIVAAAESNELADFGLPVGLTNYAAAYATGLLCARRCLKKLGLDNVLVGKTAADGEEYHIEDEDHERAPFKCVLDTGLAATVTGNRVFGCMKGAVDGGLHIPHSNKRFPGYVRGQDGADDSYDAEIHRKRIFAYDTSDYMRMLKEEDPEKFESYYSQYHAHGVTADNLESKIKACHDAIRRNPDRKVIEKKPIVRPVRDGHYMIFAKKDGSEVRVLKPRKLTNEERAQRVTAKLAEIARLAEAALAEQ